MGDGEASDRAERALGMLGTLLLGALPTDAACHSPPRLHRVRIVRVMAQLLT